MTHHQRDDDGAVSSSAGASVRDLLQGVAVTRVKARKRKSRIRGLEAKTPRSWMRALVRDEVHRVKIVEIADAVAAKRKERSVD